MSKKLLVGIALFASLFSAGGSWSGADCAARELLEQPLPHNRYSTTVYEKTAVATGSSASHAENPDLLHERLLKTFYAKYESQAFIDWSNLPGIPRGIQRFPEEARIKEIRSELARRSSPPDGTQVILIPLFDKLRFKIDGLLDEPEWESSAAKIMIGIDGAKTLLYLVSDGSELFIGCDAIDEKTETGFDQLRFFIHPDTSYLIVNERLHVSRNDADGLRQTRIKWRKGEPESENERWKKFPVTDWNIYELASGTWSFSDHKRYEARLNLGECGLPVMVPFAAFVEVESDPVYEGKKFINRVHIGELGSQQYPVWFMIEKIPGEAVEKR